MTADRNRKTHYSEAEAATSLGISVEELRSLIRHHIVDQDDDLDNVPKAHFHPSDLLVLRLLAGQAIEPAMSGS